MREPVRFADSIARVGGAGHHALHRDESAPGAAEHGLGDASARRQWLPSLREGRADWQVLLESLQALVLRRRRHSTGRPSIAASTCAASRLPTYPFQRRRHWIDAAFTGPDAALSTAQRWARLARTLDAQAQRGPLDLNAASYPAKWALPGAPDHGLRDADACAMPASSHAPASGTAPSRCWHAPASARGIGTWCRAGSNALVEAGALTRDGDAFVAPQALSQPDLAALWAEAMRLLADNRPLLDYVRHCASLLRRRAARSREPAGNAVSRRLVRSRARACTNVRAPCATSTSSPPRRSKMLAPAIPPARRLRVLEIGAGTGGTSSALLAVLPPDRTRYRFTDVSDVFLEPRAPALRTAAGRRVRLFRSSSTISQAQGYARRRLRRDRGRQCRACGEGSARRTRAPARAACPRRRADAGRVDRRTSRIST